MMLDHANDGQIIHSVTPLPLPEERMAPNIPGI